MKYPALDKVLAGKMKEQDQKTYVLKLQAPSKWAGETTVLLSSYINCDNRLSLRLQPDCQKAIKAGLIEILSRSNDHGLIGLEVDRIFSGFHWILLDPSGVVE